MIEKKHERINFIEFFRRYYNVLFVVGIFFIFMILGNSLIKESFVLGEYIWLGIFLISFFLLINLLYISQNPENSLSVRIFFGIPIFLIVFSLFFYFILSIFSSSHMPILEMFKLLPKKLVLFGVLVSCLAVLYSANLKCLGTWRAVTNVPIILFWIFSLIFSNYKELWTNLVEVSWLGWAFYVIPLIYLFLITNYVRLKFFKI
ncbi:MAG: hypothetical protein QXF25_00425 [Candidatus Pacearchaeota archaeon]